MSENVNDIEMVNTRQQQNIMNEHEREKFREQERVLELVDDEDEVIPETDRLFYQIITKDRKETIKDIKEFTPDIQLTETFHSPQKSINSETERGETILGTSPEPVNSVE